MNDKFNNHRGWLFSASVIIALALMLSLSGCIGFESRTNLSIGAPEAMEAVGKKVETLVIEISPDSADAKNVVVNLSAPPGISLTDPHTSFQQYSREFKKIPKGKKEIIYFNYSATLVNDEYSLNLEVKADNANTTRRTIKVNLSVPTPEWEIEEYWILNQDGGDFYGKRQQQVLRKEYQNGEEVYVVKDTLSREMNGTYRLYYYTVEDLSHVRTEYYEDDKIIEKMTETIDPPSMIYGFPFKVGKTWFWNGTISGIGPTEFKGEVLGKEKITVQKKDYNAYKIRLKYVYPLGTGTWEVWYSPDIKSAIMEKETVNMGGSVKESNTELVLHELPSNQPTEINPAPQLPSGWKTYTDPDKHFNFNYPGNWKINISKFSITVEEPKTSGDILSVSIEPVGKMTLEEYIKKVRNILNNIGYATTFNESYREVNGRKGYEFNSGFKPTGFFQGEWLSFNTVIFVANEKGYTIVYAFYDYGTYEPSIFLDVINSFTFKEPPVYSIVERK